MKVLINKVLGQVGYRIERKRKQDDIVLVKLKKLTKNSGPLTIFDVGAYLGETAIKFSKAFSPQSKIYAFEPFLETYEILQKNIAAYPNIKSVNIGLADSDGTAAFNSNRFAATNSLLSTSAEGIKNWGVGLMETQQQIEIPVRTIDSLMEEQGVEQIDILKMDAQGAEYKVLKGAEQAMAAGKIKLIYTEMIIMPTYEAQKGLDEMLPMMKAYGYTLYDLYLSYNPEGQLRFTDGIFVYTN
ncbi:MAG: FkbM family methyltransferase [Bacteroidota bacterium]